MKHAQPAGVFAAALLSSALSTLSIAGPNAGANIDLHLLGTTTKNACTRAATTPPCSSIDNDGDVGAYYFLHVLVTDGDATAGIAGMQFGIDYGSGRLDGVGVDIFSWTLCGTLEFPQPSPAWPNNGGGTLITWDSTNRCQTFEPDPGQGVVANAGYFYMTAYSPATFKIIPRPVDSAAKVASCAAEEDLLILTTSLGIAAFGLPPCESWTGCDAEGYPGCPTPTIQTTWSAVKSLYK